VTLGNEISGKRNSRKRETGTFKTFNYRVTGQNRKNKSLKADFKEFLKVILDYAYLTSRTINYRVIGQNRKNKSFKTDFKEFLKVILDYLEQLSFRSLLSLE
jgi:hypothetical protein